MAMSLPRTYIVARSRIHTAMKKAIRNRGDSRGRFALLANLLTRPDDFSDARSHVSSPMVWTYKMKGAIRNRGASKWRCALLAKPRTRPSGFSDLRLHAFYLWFSQIRKRYMKKQSASVALTSDSLLYSPNLGYTWAVFRIYADMLLNRWLDQARKPFKKNYR